jgi:hypothetical protein
MVIGALLLRVTTKLNLFLAAIATTLLDSPLATPTIQIERSTKDTLVVTR